MRPRRPLARLQRPRQITSRLGKLRLESQRLLKLVEALEDNDDVQTVSANFDVADDVLARLTA